MIYDGKIKLNAATIFIALLLLLSVLLGRQCNKTSELQKKIAQTEQIANQNMKAMGDSTIQLKMTRQQLIEADSALNSVVDKVDKTLAKTDKLTEVIRVRPVIGKPDTDTKNEVKQDNTDSTKYSLDFVVNDSIKSFNGSSYFYVNNLNNKLTILPDATKITNFKLNFDMVVAKYDDLKNKVTKYKIVPYYVDSDGAMHTISEEQLKFNFRGVELLDKPWTENVPSFSGPSKKSRLVGQWGLGINPVGFGPVVKDGVIKLGYAPSISFGYFLTFTKK